MNKIFSFSSLILVFFSQLSLANTIWVSSQKILDGDKIQLESEDLNFGRGRKIYVSYEGVRLGVIWGRKAETDSNSIADTIKGKKIIIDYNGTSQVGQINQLLIVE